MLPWLPDREKLFFALRLLVPAALFLVLIVCLGLVIHRGTGWLSLHVQIDACLDHGGRWDYPTGVCVFQEGEGE